MKSHQELLNEVIQEIIRIDKAKNRFQLFSWIILVALSVLGVIVASEADFGWEYTKIFLGVVTAVLATLQKAIDPGATSEKLKYRKRALELIKIEIEYTDSGGQLSAIDAERLMIKAKEEPMEILQLLAKRN